MKALLDEQLSPLIASVLLDRSLDVTAVSGRRDLVGMRDEELLDFAAREMRALVTNNVRDFRLIGSAVLARGDSHAGLILVASRRERSRAATGQIAGALEQVMRANPGGLKDREVWLAPHYE